MNLKPILENLNTLLQILAILFAGIWAYYKFIRGRLFHHKLDLELKGEFFPAKPAGHVLAQITVSNSGFTRVDLETECCVLRIFVPKDRSFQDFTDASIWGRVATIPILADHGWVEPSERICEEELITLHCGPVFAVRLVLDVSDSRSLWRASTVLVARGRIHENGRRRDHGRSWEGVQGFDVEERQGKGPERT